MEEINESLESPRITNQKPKRPTSASGLGLKNRLVNFANPEKKIDLRPGTAPNAQKPTLSNLKEHDVDRIMQKNTREEWKSLFSPRPKSSVSSGLAFLNTISEFKSPQSRPQSANISIQRKSFTPKPNYTINAFPLHRALKKIKSSNDEMLMKQSEPRLIDSKILNGLKKNMSSKTILNLNSDNPNSVSFKCLELEETELKIRPQTANIITRKRSIRIKEDSYKEQDSEIDKNTLFLKEVREILFQDIKIPSVEVSEIKRPRREIPLSIQSSKIDKEVNTSNNDVSSRFTETLKTIEKITERSAEKKYVMTKSNDFENFEGFKSHTARVFLFKSLKTKLSPKISKTDTIESVDFGSSLRIHSIKSPTSNVGTVRISPKTRPTTARIKIDSSRPMTAHLHKQNGQISHLISDMASHGNIPAPFSVALKGRKVIECDSYGIMFKPATNDEKPSRLPVSSITMKRARHSNKRVTTN